MTLQADIAANREAKTGVSPPVPDAPSPAPQYPMIEALIVSAAFFMEILDSTIIAPAVPAIARSFAATPVAVSSGISSYLITVAILIPASAWLSDRFGARNVFSCAIALFTLASVMCGISESLTQFTLARVLQGIGGAMMSPVGRIAVLRRTEKVHMLRIIAYLTWPGLSAFIVGPPLGGFLTSALSWRWIFFINIPIGVVGIILVLIYFDRSREEVRRRFDALGLVLTGGALASLMYGLESISHSSNAVLAAGWILAGVLLGTAAVRHAMRHPAPLLPLTPFAFPSFAIGAVAGGAPFRLSASGTAFLLPVMFQIAFGMTVEHASLLFGCFLAGDLTIKIIANRAVRRFGFRNTMLATSALVGLTGVGFMVIDPATPIPAVIVLLVIAGASRSVQFTALNTLVFADVPPEQIGNASTLNSMLQQMFLGLGVGFAALVLALSSRWQGHAGQTLTLTDFRVAFGFCLLLTLAAAVVYLRMPAHTGVHLTKRADS